MSKLKIVPNAECTITAFRGDNATTQRLVQMGILPGSRLRILRIGPMGSTLQILVDQGDSIALRAEELKVLECQNVAFPLSAGNLNRWHRYRVRDFLGGAAFFQKMQARGITIGEIVEVRKKNGLQLRRQNGSTVTVGWGEADKILVESPEDG